VAAIKAITRKEKHLGLYVDSEIGYPESSLFRLGEVPLSCPFLKPRNTFALQSKASTAKLRAERFLLSGSDDVS
jgi:hypothetical protein